MKFLTLINVIIIKYHKHYYEQKKICSKCDEILDINNFYKGKATCKKCYNNIVSESQKLKKEKKKETNNNIITTIDKIESDITELNIKINTLRQITNNITNPMMEKNDFKLMEIQTYCDSVLKARNEYYVINNDVEKIIKEINEKINSIKEKLNESFVKKSK